jgi:hypothetical protein
LTLPHRAAARSTLHREPEAIDCIPSFVFEDDRSTEAVTLPPEKRMAAPVRSTAKASTADISQKPGLFLYFGNARCNGTDVELYRFAVDLQQGQAGSSALGVKLDVPCDIWVPAGHNPLSAAVS